MSGDEELKMYLPNKSILIVTRWGNGLSVCVGANNIIQAGDQATTEYAIKRVLQTVKEELKTLTNFSIP